MNILITGSNGFVGSRLMWYLEEKGYKVFGIDNSEHCLRERHPNTIFGDIRNKEDYESFRNKNIEMIIHLAASKHDFGISKEEYYSNNEYGTQVVMEFAKSENIKKIIYYSTVSVYGHKAVPCDETGPILPDNDYGESKLAGEKVINKFYEEDNSLEIFYLRPSIIYGPNNFANMYNLIAMQHRKFWITIGDGSHIKSMVSLENLIDMTFWCFDRFKSGIQIYNVLDKPYITVKTLMNIIASHEGFSNPTIKIPLKIAVGIGLFFDFFAKILKKDIPINSDRMRKFATSTEYYSEKIRKDGYVQKHSIESQLGETIKWYKENYKRRKELDENYL
jgi:nucleoside-diphosphate-sugar epimerase